MLSLHLSFPIVQIKQQILLVWCDQYLINRGQACLAWNNQTLSVAALHTHPYKLDCKDQLIEPAKDSLYYYSTSMILKKLRQNIDAVTTFSNLIMASSFFPIMASTYTNEINVWRVPQLQNYVNQL